MITLYDFVIESTREEEREEEFSKGLDFKTKYKRKCFDIYLTAKNGEEFYLHSSRPRADLFRGKRVRLEVSNRITKYKWIREFLTPQEFTKRLLKQIEMNKKAISFYQEEIKQLENLL